MSPAAALCVGLTLVAGCSEWPQPSHEQAPLVAVTVFVDHECPVCARAGPWIERLQEGWPEEVDVQHLQLRSAPGEGSAEATEVAANRRIADALRVPGTPTFFVGGRQIDTTRGFGPLIPAVRRALTESRALVRAGLERAVVAREQTARSAADPRLVGWLHDRVLPVEDILRRPVAPVATADSPRDTTVWAVEVDGGEPSSGPSDALVTIVVFEDLTSEFCIELAPALDAVRRQYPHDVRVVHKLLPLPYHPQARAWARGAACAQATGEYPAFRIAALERTAEAAPAAGSPAMATCLASTTADERLAADRTLARRVSAFGTPVLYVNGQKLAGARSAEDLSRQVERALPFAEGRSAQVGRANVYADLVAGGRVREPLGPSSPSLGRPEAPALGDPAAATVVAAWLDLAAADARRVLGALLTRVRRGDIALTVYATPLAGDELSEHAARLAQCACHAGTSLRFLSAIARTAPDARHEHPLEPSGLADAASSAGLDADVRAACPEARAVDPPAGHGSPALVVNGRPYDGSLGFGPGAMERLFSP